MGGRCWYVTVPRGGLSKCPVIHEVCWDCFQWASAVYSQSSITPTHLEPPTHTPTSANGVALSVQHECRWRCGWHYLACDQIGDGVEIWFHASLFPQPCSLCWVIKFTPYLSQPHLFPHLSSLCSSAFSDLLRPCVDRDPRSGGRVCSAWACVLISKLCWNRHFHTSPYLIPELPLRLRFVSSWLISMGCIFQVELAARRTAAGYRSSGTLPECSSESLRRLKVPLATQSCTCFPHNPGSVVALRISC